MMWDGIFHAAVWVMTIVGLTLLLRAGGRADVPWSPGIFWGAWCLGWGSSTLLKEASITSSWAFTT